MKNFSAVRDYNKEDINVYFYDIIYGKINVCYKERE